MLKFIHLTDMHLLPVGRAIYGLDPSWRFSRAIDSINAEHGDAAFCVVTGDLTHYGQQEAYRELRECLGRLALPVHLLIGNHDDRGHFVEAFPEVPRDAAGFVQGTMETEAGVFVFLDTHEPGVSYGVFCAQRAAWLADALARSAPKPVFLFMHHPPFPVGIVSMDTISLRDTQAFAAALEPHRARVRHLFFGHLHRPLAGSWRGIPVSTLRGTNHQVALKLAQAKVPGSHEPPQYGVVLVEEDTIIVHMHDFLDATATFNL